MYKKFKTALIFSIISAILASALGTLLHFLYEWTGENMIVALFSPVNESVWEHLKLLFFPIMIFSVIECLIYGKKLRLFIPGRLLGTLIGIFLTVTAHYTYLGVIGKNSMVFDLILFFISVILAYFIGFIISVFTESGKSDKWLEFISVFVILLISGAFFRYSFFAPGLGIFSFSK